MIRVLKLSVYFFLIFVTLGCSNRDFNAEDWKADKYRYKQINSLIEWKILIGRSYHEVIELLGEERMFYREKDSVADGQFKVYYLTGGSNLIDLELLLIRIDSGKVVRAEKYYE